jgi:hypothetical protein
VLLAGVTAALPKPAAAVLPFRLCGVPPGPAEVVSYVRSGSAPCEEPSVEIELVALDVLHHEARLVVVIGRQ